MVELPVRERSGSSEVKSSDLTEPERASRQVARGLHVPPGTAVLTAADRFGRIYAEIDVHETSVPAALEEALGWLDYAQSRCEECGPPLDWH